MTPLEENELIAILNKVTAEFEELKKKCKKLDSLLYNDMRMGKISHTQKSLLYLQRDIMQSYESVLALRIGDLKHTIYGDYKKED